MLACLKSRTCSLFTKGVHDLVLAFVLFVDLGANVHNIFQKVEANVDRGFTDA